MDIFSPIKRILYNVYTRRLLKQVQHGPLPQHVALIPDGNRRFARLHGLGSPSAGHHLGAEKFDELLDWCDELAIPVVTVWALSMSNLGRDLEDLGHLIEIIQKKLNTVSQAQTGRRSPRSVHVMGRLEVLPESMRNLIANAEACTAQCGPMRLNIALGYDGREEITRAVKSFLVEQAEKELSLRDAASQLTAEEIGRRLYCQSDPEPDLIIRSSGELRLSGFLLWQSVNSELYFCDTLWPAFRKLDFLRALRSYQQRDRRFGG